VNSDGATPSRGSQGLFASINSFAGISGFPDNATFFKRLRHAAGSLSRDKST
jgi:hypothetical protein